MKYNWNFLPIFWKRIDKGTWTEYFPPALLHLTELAKPIAKHFEYLLVCKVLTGSCKKNFAVYFKPCPHCMFGKYHFHHSTASLLRGDTPSFHFCAPHGPLTAFACGIDTWPKQNRYNHTWYHSSVDSRWHHFLWQLNLSPLSAVTRYSLYALNRPHIYGD